MGQKVHPTGVRVGIIKDWNSKWYADSKNFADYLVEDQKIRKFLKKKLYLAGISKIEIERTAKAIKVNLYTAKPGIVIGKGGAGVESVKNELVKLIGKDINLNIVEVKNIDTDAQLVAENIAGQLERRISFRRAMKQCMQKSMKAGALGIKTAVSGRLGGADMARTEFYKEGNIPLQTLRADIKKLIGKDVNLNVVEVKNTSLDATLVAEDIASQLERRISFRRAMKLCMQKTMKSGAAGIKTAVSGRLGGADMARTEFYKEGNIPLQTLRADIDYGFAEANTTYGKIGVKVWIYKGEVLPTKKMEGGEA